MDELKTMLAAVLDGQEKMRAALTSEIREMRKEIRSLKEQVSGFSDSFDFFVEKTADHERKLYVLDKWKDRILEKN